MSDTSNEQEFIEQDGVKYKVDPDNPDEPLKDENDELVKFEESSDTATVVKDDEEIPTRKSVQDYIIERKNEKIKKLESKQGDDPEQLNEKGQQLVSDAVAEALKPFAETLKNSADKTELDRVIKTHGESAEKLKPLITKYANSEAYKNVPIESIYFQLVGRESVQSTRTHQADDEASRTRTGGATRRPTSASKIPDVSNMTDAEVIALSNRVDAGEFTN